MSDVINFLCPGCQASLSIPLEQAGVSGPCPLCATHVTSPPVEERPAKQPPRKIIPAEEEATGEPRVWLEPHLVKEKRTGMALWGAAPYITVIILALTAGLAGAWKLWEPASGEKTVITVSPEPPSGPGPVAGPQVVAIDESPDAPVPPGAEVPSARSAGVAANAAPPAKTPVAESPKPGSDAAAGLSEEEKQIRKVIPMDGFLAKPGAALVHFLAAKTWQERLKYTLAPEKAKPLMEVYYKTQPDGPVVPEDIKLLRVEATEEDANRKYYGFLLYLPDVEYGIPVSVEDTKSGCLVEWCSFAETKDRLLEKFFAAFRKEPGTFRVLARRCHYFSDDVPEQDKKECLEVVAPDNTGPFTVWLDKKNPDHAKYFAKGERQSWDVSSPLVITCQWEKTDKGAEYVRLTNVLVDSWHPDLLPASALPKAASPKNK